MEDSLPEGELPRGTQVAGYKIRHQIGSGATGAVYAAVHPSTGAKVAVKVFDPSLTHASGAAERFLERAGRICELKHPEIVEVHEVGQLELEDGTQRLFLVSEFVQGKPLSELVSSAAPFSLVEAAPLLEALAKSLEAAHQRGIVHGDLTADNIWLSPNEDGSWPPQLRVIDFGAGLLLQLGTEEEEIAAKRSPGYLAPEQCRGEDPTPLTDLYAVGVVAYQLLTGRLPFSSSERAEVLRMHQQDQVPSPGDIAPDQVTADVEEMLLKALAKKPEQRYGSMSELRQELDRLTEAERSSDLSEAEVDVSSGLEPAVEADAKEFEDEGTPDGRAEDAEVVESKAEEVVNQPAGAGPIQPVSTAELPGDYPQRGQALLTPFRSAVLAILAAVVMIAVAYRLLTGGWPLIPSSLGAAEESQLVVVSSPPGAAVFLDRVRQPSLTPMTLSRLKRGKRYELYVHLAGRLPWRQIVALGLDEERRLLRITLSPKALRFGTLQLSANVKADFFLDTRKVGTQTSQATLADVQAGVDHRLKVVAPGHRPAEQVVRVDPGKIRVLQFDLKPLDK